MTISQQSATGDPAEAGRSARPSDQRLRPRPGPEGFATGGPISSAAVQAVPTQPAKTATWWDALPDPIKHAIWVWAILTLLGVPTAVIIGLVALAS